MRRALLAWLLVAVTCTACAAAPAPPPPPLNAQLRVLVVDRAGLPIPDAHVTASRLTGTSDQRVSLPLGTVTTDPTGHASIAVPHDTIQIGLWKGDGQPVWRWQTPVIVTGDVDLAYDLVTADTLPLCPAVDPTQPDRCPPQG